MTEPRQNPAILPKSTQGRWVQALNRLNELLTKLVRRPAQSSAYPFHRAEEIHDERHRRTLGPFKQQGGPTLAQNALSDLPSLENRVHFNLYASKLLCGFKMRYECLKVTKKHNA